MESIQSLMDLFPEGMVRVRSGVVTGVNAAARNLLPQLEEGAPLPAFLELPCAAPSGSGSFTQGAFTYSFSAAPAGEEPAEEAAPASTEPQLPEGIVRFLKSKKRPDGTLANQELPPVIPVKLSPIQGGRPEEPQEPPPGLEVAPPQEEELEGQLQFGGVKE